MTTVCDLVVSVEDSVELGGGAVWVGEELRVAPRFDSGSPVILSATLPLLGVVPCIESGLRCDDGFGGGV